MTDIASPSPRGYVLGADQGLASDRPGLKASAGSTGGQLTVFTLSVEGGLLRELPRGGGDAVLLHTDLHAGNVLAAEREP